MRLRSLVLATLVLLVVGAPTALAESGADLGFDVKVAADGTVRVTQTVETDGDEFTQHIPKRREIDESSFYRYVISDVVATADGAPADLATEETPTHVAVRVRGESPVTLSYTIGGATHVGPGPQGEVTIAEWPVLAGLSLPVHRVEGTVRGPALPEVVDCFAGPRDSVGKCALISGGTFDSPEPAFQDGNRAAGDEILLVVAYAPEDVASTADVEVTWSLDRAFDTSWPAVLAALIGALLGASLIALLHRRAGRDQHPDGVSAVGSFVPTGAGESVFVVPAGVRPGHVGTVADERVDPVDVTATLIDLAVRGHLLITELPRAAHGLLDWRLERRSGGDDVAEFERILLDAVAPEDGPCLVSELPSRLEGRIEAVQEALYDDVVARGWFESRPDSTRSSWRTRGVVALGVAGLAAAALVAFTNLGLLAMVLVAVGAVLVLVADRMPRRTASGSALLTGLQALSALLATHPTDEMPAGREAEEISRLLGYAVVLGGKERWVAAMVTADVDDSPDPTALRWYHAPETWHLRDLPASLTQFVHTVQGELFAR